MVRFGNAMETGSGRMLPVTRGDGSVVGAYVVDEHGARWEPAFDLTAAVVIGNLSFLAALAFTWWVLRRRRVSKRRRITVMTEKKSFTTSEARSIGETIGIDWVAVAFDVEQFRAGMDVELEHGRRADVTDVTGDDPIVTGRIALAHLREFPDYYTRLAEMERTAEEYWAARAH